MLREGSAHGKAVSERVGAPKSPRLVAKAIVYTTRKRETWAGVALYGGAPVHVLTIELM